MNRFPLFSIAAVFLVVACGALHAAQKALKVDVELVMVNASVKDSEEHPLIDLTADNFQVFEDKVEQTIRYFSTEAAPVSIGIVFDISHSMVRKLDFAKGAAVRFLQ